MLWNYLKIAVKVLRRRKFFTFISLFAISFTLLVLMVATAMLDHVFAAYPPETRAERTLLVMRATLRGPSTVIHGGAGYGFLDAHVRTLPGVELVSIASKPQRVISYIDDRKMQSFLRRTDGEFWKILDFDFVEGGPFTPEDERNASPVAVINEATRDRFFGGAQALGRTLEAGNQRFRVVGVVRNVPLTREVPFSDIWVPISTQLSDGYRSELVGDYTGMILARDVASLPGLKSEFDARLARVQLPDSKVFDAFESGADTLFESMSRNILPTSGHETHPVWLRAFLIGLALLFMTLPTLNLVNINLSRILERASEIGVRKAFGASSFTLVGQFLVENILLTLVGAALGWILSVGVLRAINVSGVIPYADFHLNLRILFYGVLSALVFGVMSGIYPAWRMSRMHPVRALTGRPE